MTREEAIRWIQLDIDMAKFDPTTGEDAYLNDDAKNVIEAQEMAISALKAQMDGDTISRQEATGIVLFECGEFKGLANTIIKRFEDLPSAQPEQRWIPCSERLPSPLEWDEKYLVSLAWGGIGVMEYKSTGFHNYGSFNPVPIETVIAWMPLPEPYKVEEIMR